MEKFLARSEASTSGRCNATSASSVSHKTDEIRMNAPVGVVANTEDVNEFAPGLLALQMQLHVIFQKLTPIVVRPLIRAILGPI